MSLHPWKLLASAALVLSLVGTSHAQMAGRMSSVTVPEEPALRLPSDRPTYMTTINYPLTYGAFAMWPYAAPITLTNSGGLPSRINDISMRPTPVITRAYAPSMPPAATSATVTVNLPATASLWFEGMRVPNLGSVRRFASPDLNPLLAYTYDIKATWMENGKVMTQSQRLIVRSGDRTTVTFPTTQPTLQTPAIPAVAPERVIEPQISKLPAPSVRLARR